MPNITVPKRAATVVAALDVAVWFASAAWMLRVFVKNSGGVPPLSAWALLPLTLIVIGVAASRGDSAGPMWTAIGALWGFVVAAAWSAGLFFAPAALALTIAGVIHLAAIRSWWQTLLAPLWLLLGVTAIGVMFLAIDILRRAASGDALAVSHAPAIVAAAWLFVAASAAIAGSYAARWSWRAWRASRPWLVALVLILDVAIVSLVGSQTLKRARVAVGPGGHGMSCWSENGKTTCQQW
jgi:hypothetical protein